MPEETNVEAPISPEIEAAEEETTETVDTEEETTETPAEAEEETKEPVDED